jgi:acyl carrier protein
VEIKAEVRQYIHANFLIDGNGISINDATPLITGGLVDSIGMFGLVRFIERRFGIEFLPKEVDADRLDTIDAIAQLIQRKLETAPR